ncbi:ABC transporter permease [Salinadaptatus halalkaliphilus]|uniref:ABC transporter permease n=1 Tax=Salinadaptatus halalkaliphilus TaxID=2419781 RepID=A0A4V3VKU6_9EURY|nr:ABC transporter permease [Salinadaptatus halalkaliphilus]THE63167.1 ABC transporter permease [Salinadaptatus halalkaliphilus]
MVSGRYLVKRFVHGILVVWGAITLIFVLRHISPGSPINVMTPPTASPELRERVAEELGLNQPIYVQYLDYLGGVLTGDLGNSYVRGAPVSQLLIDRAPATIELAIAATVIALIIAIPLGVISATNRDEPLDYGASLASLLGISTPNFWLGLMLIMVVSVQIGFFPTSGRGTGFVAAVQLLVFEMDAGGFVTWFQHIILPAITLGTYFMALITRLTRSEMLEELEQEYVQVCRAKGLPEPLVLYKHALRNSMLPVVTVVGLQVGYLIGGSIVVEVVFSWPGVGNLIIDALTNSDWMIIQGYLILVSVSWVTVNFFVDVTYTVLDPTVSLE